MKKKDVLAPLGMILKKYHCPKCGKILEKQKITKIVTRDDPKYYAYHSRTSFPKDDVEVMIDVLECPSCKDQYSYEDCCLIKIIQKKEHSLTLSPKKLETGYDYAFKITKIRNMILNIIASIVFIICGILIWTFVHFREYNLVLKTIIITLFFAVALMFGYLAYLNAKKKHFSLDEKKQLEKLYTYSRNNVELIKNSTNCYCFACKQRLDVSDIYIFVDNKKTAVCPNCKVDAILPDAIDETLNKEIINKMNQYWF